MQLLRLRPRCVFSYPLGFTNSLPAVHWSSKGGHRADDDASTRPPRGLTARNGGLPSWTFAHIFKGSSALVFQRFSGAERLRRLSFSKRVRTAFEPVPHRCVRLARVAKEGL
jgi:hypothetical protein